MKIKERNIYFKFFSGSYYSSAGDALQIIDSNQLYLKFDGLLHGLSPLSDTSFTSPDGQTLIFQKSKKPVGTFLFVTDEGHELFTRLKKPVLTETELSACWKLHKR